MSFLCNRLEETLTPPMQSEFTRLVYDDPLTFANLVLNGELENYLKNRAKDYNEQESNLREQLKKHYPPVKTRELTREFMMYDS